MRYMRSKFFQDRFSFDIRLNREEVSFFLCMDFNPKFDKNECKKKTLKWTGQGHSIGHDTLKPLFWARALRRIAMMNSNCLWANDLFITSYLFDFFFISSARKEFYMKSLFIFWKSVSNVKHGEIPPRRIGTSTFHLFPDILIFRIT